MGNEIPTRSRRIVKAREGERCLRCGGAGTDWHHRRRRNVRNGHFQHCPCLGVLLCRTCHNWVHSHPAGAMESGFIVSSYEEEPWTVPVRIWTSEWQTNDCEGGFVLSVARPPSM